MSKKKARTQYDLQAWEMLTDKPEVVLMVTDSKGDIIQVEPCINVSFVVYDSFKGCILNIIGFDRWLYNFNKYHGVKCYSMNDIREFYKKGGALHW